jgi:nitrogen fixation/metabolism regulation signal transduction histidine kinase
VAALIRVIGHELNNSLAPIKSIAGSLESLLGRDPMPADWRDDMSHGLSIIARGPTRSGRFTSAYARLARLPPPSRVATELAPLVRPRRVARITAADRARRGPAWWWTPTPISSSSC